MRVANCDKICESCLNCYDVSKYRIRDILYAIDEKISQYSQYLICTTLWGYGCKRGVTDEEFEKLFSYKNTLLRYYNSIMSGGQPCLCPEELNKVIEKTLDIVDLSCCTNPKRKDIEEDLSGLELWVLNNPGCVAYEEWERGLIRACPKIGITVRSVKKSCEVVAFINKVEDICKFLYTVSVYNVAKSCIQPKVKVNKVECKIQYDVFIKEHDCNIDYKTFVKLIECNMTPKIIGSFIDCGLDLRYDVKSSCPEIKVDPKTSLLLCNTDINVFSKDVDKALLSQYSSGDLDQFEIDELIESYVNDCEIIKKEIDGI